MLAAGMDGVKNKLTPPQPVEESTYEMTPEEIVNRGIDTVPRNLREALEELSKDDLIKSVLGEAMFKRYYDIKMAEWDEFRIHVTDWEKERYMEVY